MKTLLIALIGSLGAFVVGCGDSSGGGGGAGSATLEATQIAVGDTSSTVGCAAFKDGGWSTAETSFDSGAPSNPDCALVPIDAGGTTSLWLTSESFEGTIGTGAETDLRHNESTVEAAVTEGSSPLTLYGADDPETPIFTGTVTISDLGPDSLTIAIQ